MGIATNNFCYNNTLEVRHSARIHLVHIVSQTKLPIPIVTPTIHLHITSMEKKKIVTNNCLHKALCLIVAVDCIHAMSAGNSCPFIHKMLYPTIRCTFHIDIRSNFISSIHLFKNNNW
jgi:hypothetical protein